MHSKFNFWISFPISWIDIWHCSSWFSVSLAMSWTAWSSLNTDSVSIPVLMSSSSSRSLTWFLLFVVFQHGFSLAGRWILPPPSHWLCKSRAFVVFTSRTMAIWLIMIASIDRWLLSSANHHRRQMSTIRNIKRSIVISCILCATSYIHMLYCYEADIFYAPLRCYSRNFPV